jgi:hypothetical protein
MISLRIFSRSLFLAAVALALASWGCASDSDRSRVRGAVSYNSEPVDDGGIAFIPDGGDGGGIRATGPIQDGRYDLDDKSAPYPGKYRVEIYWN